MWIHPSFKKNMNKLLPNYCITLENFDSKLSRLFVIALPWISNISTSEIVTNRELIPAIARQAPTEMIQLPGGGHCQSARDNLTNQNAYNAKVTEFLYTTNNYYYMLLVSHSMNFLDISISDNR